jgi:hypothetical protein
MEARNGMKKVGVYLAPASAQDCDIRQREQMP